MQSKELNAIIGKNIRFKRKQLGLSIEELAIILDIKSGFLGLVERGQRGASLKNLYNICKLFNITLDDLVFKDLEQKDIKNENFINNEKEEILLYLNILNSKELNYLCQVIKEFTLFCKHL